MYIVVFITAKDKDEAEKIAAYLVGEKLAACVNIVPGVSSFFWWEKKIDQAQEVLLIVKSKKILFKKMIAAVKKAHSYSVPEIIALPVIGGNKDYLKWISDSVVKKQPDL